MLATMRVKLHCICSIPTSQDTTPDAAGLLQQFQYVIPEEENDDDEQTRLAAMDIGVEPWKTMGIS